MTFGKTPTGAVLVLQRGCGSDGANETSAGYLILGTSKVISTTQPHCYIVTCQPNPTKKLTKLPSRQASTSVCCGIAYINDKCSHQGTCL